MALSSVTSNASDEISPNPLKLKPKVVQPLAKSQPSAAAAGPAPAQAQNQTQAQAQAQQHQSKQTGSAGTAPAVRKGFVPIRPALRPLLPKPASADDSKPSGVHVKSKFTNIGGPTISIRGRKRRGDSVTPAPEPVASVLSKRRRSPSQPNRVAKPAPATSAASAVRHQVPVSSKSTPELGIAAAAIAVPLTAADSSASSTMIPGTGIISPSSATMSTVSPSVFVDSHLSISLADLTTNCASEAEALTRSSSSSPIDLPDLPELDEIQKLPATAATSGKGAVASVMSTVSSLSALAARLAESTRSTDDRYSSYDPITDELALSVQSFSPCPSEPNDDALGFDFNAAGEVPIGDVPIGEVDATPMSFTLEMEAERAAAEMAPPSPGNEFDALSLDFGRATAAPTLSEPVSLDPMQYFGPQVDLF